MEKIITKGIFFIALAIFALSFRKSIDNNKEPLGIDTTKELKGLAIAAVLIGHMAIVFQLIEIPVTMYLGAQAVEIFLFLSAFGLMCSFNKNGLHKFIRKRVLVIFIPYMVFIIIRTIVLSLVGQTIGVANFIAELFALKVTTDPSMWYIQYIIIWYIIFFIVFSIKSLSQNQKAFTLLFIGTIFYGISVYIWSNQIVIKNPLSESISHHLAFPLGAVFYLYYDKFKNLSNQKYLIVSVLSGVVYAISSALIPNIFPYYIANISFIVLLVSLLMLLTKNGYKSKLLLKLGDMSYYIYLNEMGVMVLVISTLKPSPMAVLAIILISILVAIPIKFISNLILKVIKRTCPSTNTNQVEIL